MLDGSFEHALSDRVVRLWANFAAGVLDPAWPRYTSEGDQLLHLGNTTTGILKGWEDEHCGFLEGHIMKQFEF